MKLAPEQYETFHIPIHQIWVNPDFNSRRGVISQEHIASLAEDIDRRHLMHPVQVQPIEEVEGAPPGFKYRLIVGFCRLMAFKLLGREEIPANLRLGLTEREARMLNYSENRRRKDLNIMEEALFVDAMFPPYRTITSIAKELDESELWVRNRRKLLLMPELVQNAAASGRLTESDLRLIFNSSDPEGKAKEIMAAADSGRKGRLTDPKRPRTKAEIRALMTKLLAEGFNPHLIRLLGWVLRDIGNISLEESLEWLRERKGWLK